MYCHQHLLSAWLHLITGSLCAEVVATVKQFLLVNSDHLMQPSFHVIADTHLRCQNHTHPHYYGS